MSMEIDACDLEELRLAKRLLERPSLAIRLSDALGTPIERGMELLPQQWAETLQHAVHAALEKALAAAVRSLEKGTRMEASPRFHHLAVAAAGATGGAFGLPGLVFELPVSTTLMLRAIAGIARQEGEKLETLESRLACLEVFALGGVTTADDASETGYFALRAALSRSISEAARYLTHKGAIEGSAPVIARLIAAVGSRFGIVVTEKMAAMAVPAIGAAGGALVNTLFMSHFQDMATGHFKVRRLERIYGRPSVREAWNRLETNERDANMA